MLSSCLRLVTLAKPQPIRLILRRFCSPDTRANTSSKKMSVLKERVLLPTCVVPKGYHLHITPDLEKFSFSGFVEIQLEVKEKTNKITFHALDLTFSEVEVRSANGTAKVSGKDVKVEEKEETASVELPFELAAGTTASMLVDYTGILNDKMKGFYRSKYTRENGETRHLGCTQFEATDARRALPCWDEPALKSVFTFAMTYPKGQNLKVLANMPEDRVVERENNQTVYFKPSPIMSTYLLAWVIGEFDFIEQKTKHGVTVRVFTLPGKSDQGRFGLRVGVESLDFYDDHFEIPYPLPKLDMVAIPDFAAGAMENWGLVTYREVALLVDEKNTSTSTKQHVAIVVAHELAHQWFGNLSTMEWWRGLWLNEGFASFMEYLAVNEIYPEWNIWTSFVSTDVMRALNLDSLKSSHPIEVEVYHPSEINEIFDAISYSKGCSVIRMIQSFLGAEVFRKACVKYLRKFSYKNTVTEDLWDALEEESGKPVRAMMNGWTLKTGYPVVSVTQEGGKFHFKQHRFLCDGLEKDDQDLWHVPLLVSRDGKVSSYLMSERELTLDIPGSSFVKVNVGQSGPFRVLYSPELLTLLSESVRNNEIEAVDRLGLQNDALALSRAGLLSTVKVLELFSSYLNETDYTVWMDLSTSLGELASLLKHTDLAVSFDNYAASIYTKISATLGWEKKVGESDLTCLLRGLVLSQLVKYGDANTIKEGASRFEAAFQNKSEIDPDIRFAVYSAALKTNGSAGFDQLLSMYRASSLSEEKNRILRCLGTTSDSVLLKRTLEFSMSDEVRSQDAVTGIAQVISNRVGSIMGWEYIQSNWEVFSERYTGMFLMARLVQSVATFNSHDKAKEIEAFFENKSVGGAERGILQTLEKIHSNANWLDREYSQIKEFLIARKA